jgi:4-hydroxythreonine-4-phosphate dehydrogenase
MGDPAGIGPEIVLKALSDRSTFVGVKPIIIGDLHALRQRASDLSLDVALYDEGSAPKPASLPVVDLANLSEALEIGRESAAAGMASGQYIERAVDLWRNGTIDAIATAPINKKALHMGGFDFPGHTEFLAALTGTTRFAMSFFADKLRVVLLSTHLPLREAIALVKTEALIDLIEFTDGALARLLGTKVKLAVAGVNPHASEHGLFGSEEEEQITPAVDACLSRGIDVSGPFSPDTIFLRAYRGEFDAVIACYHDQATIPVKAFSFGSAVNVTLGLPFVRTSVDHGTAYDLAGRGLADASSMKAAIRLAGELSLAGAPQRDATAR